MEDDPFYDPTAGDCPWDDDFEEGDICPYCGKPYEEFADFGCPQCDVRCTALARLTPATEVIA